MLILRNMANTLVNELCRRNFTEDCSGLHGQQ